MEGDHTLTLDKSCTFPAGAKGKVIQKFQWRPVLPPDSKGKNRAGVMICAIKANRNEFNKVVMTKGFDDIMFFGVKIMCCDGKTCSTSKRCNKPDSDECIGL